MKKLVMNGILKFFTPEIISSLVTIPEYVREEILKIAYILRESGKV